MILKSMSNVKNKYNDLSLEERIIIAYSFIKNIPNCFFEIKDIIVDWNTLFKYAISNRVLPMVWKNICDYGKVSRFPKYNYDIAKGAYLYNIEKNKLYLQHLQSIKNELSKNEIKCQELKGAYLLDTIYKDYGLRSLGDIDLLIYPKDKDKIENPLNKIGFYLGKYNSNCKKILKPTRSETIKWKLNMSNLYPFTKISDSKVLSVIKLDFRFSLSDDLNDKPVNEIMDFICRTGYIKSVHVLIQLCSHLYDESKQSMNIVIGKDINLIKYIDIREYILQKMSDDDLKEAVEFCLKYGLEKQLYYTLYHLRLIYNDGYEEKYMNMLNITDDSFLNTYSDNSISNQHIWKKTFFERMFSGDNRDELDELPKFFRE